METTKSKEDCKDLRNDVTDLRDKINDLDKRVRLPTRLVIIIFIIIITCFVQRHCSQIGSTYETKRLKS